MTRMTAITTIATNTPTETFLLDFFLEEVYEFRRIISLRDKRGMANVCPNRVRSKALRKMMVDAIA